MPQPFSQYQNLADRVLVDTAAAWHRQPPAGCKMNKSRMCRVAAASQILPSAAKAVPGGKLIYCTCTFTRQETKPSSPVFCKKTDFRLCTPDLPKAFASLLHRKALCVFGRRSHHTDGFYLYHGEAILKLYDMTFDQLAVN
ncbi:MAG: hypothetical protein ACLT0Y_02965 [Christensenellales bacterium]